MHKAKVAVITRTKNRKVLLPRAIDSVLNQTFEDWRHVIVNDGGGREHVEPFVERERERYKDRVHVLHHETSKGMEAASNAGIRASQSDYVVIHDDDDAWHPDFLRETVAFMEEHQERTNMAGVVAHSIVVKESIEGDQVIKISEAPFNEWMKAITLYRLAARNSFPPISFLFKREALDVVGWFREDLPVLGDWDFHLRFVMRYDVGLIAKPLAYYHHRLALMNGEYSNTVIGGTDKHDFHDAALRNEMLRKDLASGVVGMGFLVNVSRSFEDLNGNLNHFGSQITPSLFGYVKDQVYNLGKRAKLIKE